MNALIKFSKENVPNFLNPLIVSAACLVGAGAVSFKIWQKNVSKFKVSSPQKWVKVGVVDQLFIYPVKSCTYAQIQDGESVFATSIGLKSSRLCRDRIFMVVASDGKYLSQTQCPEMAVLTVKIQDDKITLGHPAHEGITITVSFTNEIQANGKPSRTIYEGIPFSLDCGDEVATWLQTVLKRPGLRLYFHNLEKSQRKEMTKLQKTFPTFLNSDKGAFQDRTSYLVMTTESFNELNQKLVDKVPVINFRPNIVVKEIPEAFAEDSWGFIRIGDKDSGPIFKASLPCPRCKQTTVDQERGTFSEEGQPLKTLYTMKRKVADDETNSRVKNQAILGIHMGLYSQGEFPIKSGDAVYAALL